MIALCLALTAPSHAGSAVIQELHGVHSPLVSADLGTELSNTDTEPRILLGAAFRGFGGDDVGMHAGSLTAAARLDPADPDADRLRGTATVLRWVGESYPVPVVWDVHLGQAALTRDDRLGFAADGVVTAASAVAGFMFPAVEPGDFDGHVVAELAVGGGHRREYLDPDLEPFSGVRLGGVGGELRFGWALARGVVLGPHLDGHAAWSLGVSGRTSLVTDTSVDGGLTLRLGRHLALMADGGAESTRDPGNELAASFWRGALRLRVAE